MPPFKRNTDRQRMRNNAPDLPDSLRAITGNTSEAASRITPIILAAETGSFSQITPKRYGSSIPPSMRNIVKTERLPSPITFSPILMYVQQNTPMRNAMNSEYGVAGIFSCEIAA